MQQTWTSIQHCGPNHLGLVVGRAGQLVTNLSFEIQPGGDSLLLIGHNGAGKSSIFRCLAALWNVPAGKITKPVRHTELKLNTPNPVLLCMCWCPDFEFRVTQSDFSSAVFYIPQRAYNVLGTLAEQITYPAVEAAAGLSRDELVRISPRRKCGLLSNTVALIASDCRIVTPGAWQSTQKTWTAIQHCGPNRLGLRRFASWRWWTWRTTSTCPGT